MSIQQSLDTNTNANRRFVKCFHASTKAYDTRCNFFVTNDMLLKLHKLAAAKHYKSMSVLIRDVVEQYLKTEGM
jgi:hypothetical protein